MRTITILSVMVVLALLLQGCGRKAPLTLPSTKAQTSKAQASSPQTPELQKTTEPAKPQGNEP